MTEDRRPMTEDRQNDRRPMTGGGDGRPKADSAHGPSSSVSTPQRYKFQDLEVYKLALRYLDNIYDLVQRLPDVEKYNLRSQIERAATSVVLNIAEGSTGQSDPEQSRFVTMAIRSYLETVACLDIAQRRGYMVADGLHSALESGRELFAKLQALRRALSRPGTGDK